MEIPEIGEMEKEARSYSVKVSNIVWDTDGQVVDDLPNQVIIHMTDDDVDDDISDMLSDEYGWCVDSFLMEYV